MRKRILALTLALSLLLTACGGGASAATMRLRKTEGTVGVSDDGGKDVAPRDDLGLYSGYGVDTQTESYAWIDLDSVKLTKLDQDSEIAITKEGKELEIEVKSGSLFFNVTEPLADDETMDIRTSTMMVGIRGTCGWVTQDTAALLEGTVEVTAGEQAVTISAGEMAVLTAEGELVVKSFYQEGIPSFVVEESLGGDILDKIPAIYPLAVLTKQTIYCIEYDDLKIVEYFYDEEGYALRSELRDYFNGELQNTQAYTYHYDGEGNCWYEDENGFSSNVPCKPGSIYEMSTYIDFMGTIVDANPLLPGYSELRAEIESNGRREFPSGSYSIYTMDENDNPVYIETYGPDGVLNGTATFEWAVINP